MASSERIVTDDESSFELLADATRRHALDVLREVDQPIALADLAADIAVRETGGPATEVARSRLKRLQVSLHHNHLPKLEAEEVVEYDSDRRILDASA